MYCSLGSFRCRPSPRLSASGQYNAVLLSQTREYPLALQLASFLSLVNSIMNDVRKLIALHDVASLLVHSRFDDLDRNLQALCKRLGLFILPEAVDDEAVGSEKEDVGNG